jgi:mycothiol synthase
VPGFVITESPLDPATAEAVRRLAAAVERVDGAPPLSDQALSRLGAPGGTDVVLRREAARDTDEHLAGYARLDVDTTEIAAAADAVAAVLDAVEDRTTAHRLLVWSHGHRSRLIAGLESAGYERIRELHQLRRPLAAADLPPDPPLPPDVTVRPFRPGEDDDAWLALNAAAFVTHPEQGRWGPADLAARVAESWFDADGFLVAERDGALLGFHWTKVHPDGAGEVYVLGVAPDAQGLGLGTALLIRGLRHLAARGCPSVLLYVDGENTTAVRLYERQGFERFDLDVQWSKTIRTTDNDLAS